MNQPIKHSKQREALFELLKSVICHPDAEWLYNELKKDFPKISLATVYRNLGQFCALGKAIPLYIGDGTVRYDARTSAHNHFFCSSCHNLYDIGDAELCKTDAALEEKYGVKIDSHSFIFYGKCKNCIKNKNLKEKKS